MNCEVLKELFNISNKFIIKIQFLNFIWIDRLIVMTT